MPNAHLALTPDALVMMDTIARTGSFAAAARELGKVPSALTYSVRQLEEHLDVLLFDRRSRQAQLTAAGTELLDEGRRLLGELEGVANRVRRVATGWEGHLTIAVDDVIHGDTVFDLCEAFYALHPEGKAATTAEGTGGPGTRLRLRTEVLAGTWEALVSGRADLAIGVASDVSVPPGVATDTLGELAMVFAMSPGHPMARLAATDVTESELVRHRAVAVADSAQRSNAFTVNLLPGQDVFTVTSMAAKVAALERGLGVGWVPAALIAAQLADGRLVTRRLHRARNTVRLAYAWRCATTAGGRSRKGPGAVTGLALQWWLQQLASETTRRALLQR